MGPPGLTLRPFARPAHFLNRSGRLLSGDERRPALVVSRDGHRRADLVVYITPAPRAGPDVAPIAPALGTGLEIPSVVRSGKLATLDPAVVACRFGDAPLAWLDAHRVASFGAFGFEPP